MPDSKHERLPDVAIFITATSWVGFALWLGFNPGALLPAFGIDASSPAMLTEIRAFYGGVEFAIAAAMILCWWRGEKFASLLIGGLPLIGSATGRISGLVFDGFSMLHLGFAGLEIIGASFCLVACRILSQNKRMESKRKQSP
ncbi:MAG: DUF4345 family protein [Planctomycetota bacterium]